jgi:hypothetical protein
MQEGGQSQLDNSETNRNMRGRPSKAAESLFHKLVTYIGKQEIRNQIQMEIIDPLLNHIMHRIFPYIILICVLFILLLISVLLTLGIIVFFMRRGGGSSGGPLRLGET